MSLLARVFFMTIPILPSRIDFYLFRGYTRFILER